MPDNFQNLNLEFLPSAGIVDWTGCDLTVAGDPLVSAVLISLFTWRRARDDDELPDPDSTDRLGWWGDGDFGSRLWLLHRAKLTYTVLHRAREYAAEALAWLPAAGVCSEVRVDVDSNRLDRLYLRVELLREGTSLLNLQWQDLWGAMGDYFVRQGTLDSPAE